jgi:hypothetical protein
VYVSEYCSSLGEFVLYVLKGDRSVLPGVVCYASEAVGSSVFMREVVKQVKASRQALKASSSKQAQAVSQCR